MAQIVAPHFFPRVLRKSISSLGFSTRLAEVFGSEWRTITGENDTLPVQSLLLDFTSFTNTQHSSSLSGQHLHIFKKELTFSAVLPLHPWDQKHVARKHDEALVPAEFRRSYHSSCSVSGNAASDSRECWSCQAEKAAAEPFFCSACGKIQPVNPLIDYFTLLSMDGKYPMDTRELEGTYKALQKKLHPDMFSTKSEEEKMHSASQSAHVIKAYYTLLRPLDRAKYLLQLLGEDVLANDEGTIDNQDLLMEMMEVREAVESATDDEMLERLAAENNSKREKCLADLTAAFERGDLKAAKSWMHRLTYLERIADEILQRQ